MIDSRVLAIGLLSLSALCAAAHDSNSGQDMMRLLGSRGRLLYPEELHGNCAGLTITAKTHIDRLRELKKKAAKEREGPPPTLFGEAPATSALVEEENRVQALNVVLDSKGCDLVNVEEELKKTPASQVAPKANDRQGVRRKSQ